MSELDIEIRYGFIKSEQAEMLEEPAEQNNLKLRLFERQEDYQWSLGAASRTAKSAGLSPHSRTVKANTTKLHQEALQARQEGMTPFRVVGEPESFPEFLKQLNLLEVEFVT